MSIRDLGVAEEAFLRKLMKSFGVKQVQVERAGTGDISVTLGGSIPIIRVGEKWAAASPDERKKRLLHEFLHIGGLRHDARMRSLGYYSRPERDEYSRKVYERFKKVRNPSAYVTDIESKTLKNRNYREVLKTAPHSQLTVMSLKPREDIGMEMHKHGDQFIRVEKGSGKAILDGQEHKLQDGSAVVIPEGTKHNIVNTSSAEALKLYSIYSPPEHADGLVQKTKAHAVGRNPFMDKDARKGLISADDPVPSWAEKSNAYNTEARPYADEWIKTSARNNKVGSISMSATWYSANHVAISGDWRVRLFLQEALGRPVEAYREGWLITADEAAWLGFTPNANRFYTSRELATAAKRRYQKLRYNPWPWSSSVRTYRTFEEAESSLRPGEVVDRWSTSEWAAGRLSEIQKKRREQAKGYYEYQDDALRAASRDKSLKVFYFGDLGEYPYFVGTSTEIAVEKARQREVARKFKAIEKKLTSKPKKKRVANPVVMKGMGRALGQKDGVPLPNDLGVVFATTSTDVATKYADYGGNADGSILHFRYADSARIANMSNVNTVKTILQTAAKVYPTKWSPSLYWEKSDLQDPDFIDGAALEIANPDEGWGELAIMDDPGIIKAVKKLGYDGVTDGTNFAFVNKRALSHLNPIRG